MRNPLSLFIQSGLQTHKIYSTPNKNYIYPMKILANKKLLLLVLLVQAVLTFHEPLRDMPLDVSQADIVASDYSSQQKILALLTRSRELKFYKKVNGNYIFVQKVPTCQGSGLTISHNDYNSDANSHGPNLLVTVRCISDEAIYEFDSKSKIVKEVTVKKFIMQALESLQGIVPVRSTRLLANTTNSTSCNSTYFSNQTNGTVCGDGNTKNGDGCSSTCTIEYCGDAITNNNGTEQCDDGNSVSGDGCFNCKLECGNGILNFGEQCDDGNTVDGDGCSSTCKQETFAAALPLALGIPVVVVALLGVIIAKCILGKSAAGAAGAAYAQPGQPGQLEMEESTKVLRQA